MALDLQPAYHTETMVNILRQQGSTGLAMELAENIIHEHPEKESVQQLLKEMKQEARASFERFRQAGLEKLKKTQEGDEEEGGEVDKVIPLRPQEETQASSQKNKKTKVEALQNLLARVEAFRAKGS